MQSRRQRWQRPVGIGVNVASMIDVVFLLLVYFMAVTEFRPREKVFRLDLPERQSSPYDPLYDAAIEPLVILIEDVRAGADYTLTLSGGWPPVTDATALGEWLRTHRVGNSIDASRGLFTARHPIIVLAASRTAWRNVVEVFNAVVGAGYDSVSLDVQP